MRNFGPSIAQNEGEVDADYHARRSPIVARRAQAYYKALQGTPEERDAYFSANPGSRDIQSSLGFLSTLGASPGASLEGMPTEGMSEADLKIRDDTAGAVTWRLQNPGKAGEHLDPISRRASKAILTDPGMLDVPPSEWSNYLRNKLMTQAATSPVDNWDLIKQLAGVGTTGTGSELPELVEGSS